MMRSHHLPVLQIGIEASDAGVGGVDVDFLDLLLAVLFRGLDGAAALDGSVLEHLLGDVLVVDGGFECSLVDHGLQVAGVHAFAEFNEARVVDAFLQRTVGEMEAEHGKACFFVGQADEVVLVQTAGAQEGRVDEVGGIGGADDEDAITAAVVDLGEEDAGRLVVVGKGDVGRPRTGRDKCLYLVYTEDKGCGFARLLEEIP